MYAGQVARDRTFVLPRRDGHLARLLERT
jgi:hypothetical protein